MSGDNSLEAGFYMAVTAPPLLQSMKQAYQTVTVVIATASESTGRAKLSTIFQRLPLRGVI